MGGTLKLERLAVRGVLAPRSGGRGSAAGGPVLVGVTDGEAAQCRPTSGIWRDGTRPADAGHRGRLVDPHRGRADCRSRARRSRKVAPEPRPDGFCVFIGAAGSLVQTVYTRSFRSPPESTKVRSLLWSLKTIIFCFRPCREKDLIS